MITQIRKHFTFEAAHVLPNHPGKCGRMHGHSYRLEVAVEGPLRESGPTQGMVEDFYVISQITHETIVEKLDHICLNDILSNPTAEAIALWIWERLAPKLQGLCEVVLWETPTACAVVRADPHAANR